MRRRGALSVAALALAALSACAALRDSPAQDQYIRDAALSSAVRSRLADDPRAPGPAVAVESLRGVVELSGRARSGLARDRASQIARTVPGVKEVRNDIVVSP